MVFHFHQTAVASVIRPPHNRYFSDEFSDWETAAEFPVVFLYWTILLKENYKYFLPEFGVLFFSEKYPAKYF